MTLLVNWSECGVKDGTSLTGGVGWKGGQRRKRTIRVKHSDANTALLQAVGYSYPLSSGGFRYLRRELPDGLPWIDTTLHCVRADIAKLETWTGRAAYDKTTYALLPGYPNANATKTDETSQGFAAGLPNDNLMKTSMYHTAQVQLEYESADFYIRDDAYIDGPGGGNEINRFTSYREDRQVKGIVIPGNLLYMINPHLIDPNGPESIPFSVPRVEFEKTVYVKWIQVAVDAVPWQTIDSMIGTINKFTFLNIYPPDSLLMLTPRVDRYVMANGLIGCDIEFCYQYAPNLQTKLLHVQSPPIEYRWVVSDRSIVTEPIPGTLADGVWLFNERDHEQAFVPNNP